jgi:UPF0716 protein FxsA
MFKIFFLAFLIVPLAELYVLIQVGSAIGAMTTIGLCLFTAALGAYLLKLQGIETIKRVQAQVNNGKMPATELIGGLILLISGFLLLTPGLITDIAGFLCLVPGFRVVIATGLLSRLILQRRNDPQETDIIEGEFWDEKSQRIRHNDDMNGK